MAENVPPPELAEPKPRPLQLSYWWLKYLLGLPLALIGLVALGMMTLDSAIGHRLLADGIAGYESETGLRLSVGRINGSIYGSASLEDVVLHDPHGAFMRVPAVDLDWRPLDWFGSGLDIRNLALKRGTLLRVPQLRAGDPNSPLLPDFDIRIDRLAVEKLTVAKPILGSERRIDLHAKAAIRKESVSLNVEGRLGGADRLAAVLDSDRTQNRFNLALDYVAPRTGLLAALSGAKVDRKAQVSGKGNWTNWTGGILADQGGTRIAALKLTQRQGQLGLAGRLWTDPLLSADLRGAIGPSVALSGQGHLAKSMLTGTIGAASAHWHLGAAGGVDLSANRFADLTIAGKSLDTVRIDSTTSLAGASLRAVLTGDFAKTHANWSLRAGQFANGKTHLAGITAQGTAGRQAAADKPPHWQVPLIMRIARITTDTPTVDPQLVDIKAHGTFALRGGRLTGDDLTLTSPRLSARLALRGDTKSGGYALAGRATAKAWPLASLGPTDADGALVITLSRGVGWAVNSRLTGAVPRVTNPTLARLAGDNARFAGEVTAGKGRPLLVSRANITSPLLTLALSGRLRPDGTTELSGSGRHSSYGSFSGNVSLANDGPHAELTLLDPLPAAGVKDMKLALAPVGASYRLTTSGDSTLGPFAGVLALVVPDVGPARLDIAHFALSNTGVTGGLVLAASGTSGTLRLGGGGVSGTIALAPRGEGTGVDVALAADDAHFGGDVPLTIGSGKLNASGLLLKHHTTITGSALAQGIGKGRLFIGKAAANVRLQDGVGQITMALGGRRGSRFDLQATADVAPERLAVTARGLFAGQTIAMPRRAVLTTISTSEGGGWRLAPSEVDFGGGRAIASGAFGNAGLELRLGLVNMPLSLADVLFVNLGLGGRASGQFTYSRRREAMPEGEAQLMLHGLTRSGLVLTSKPIDLALVGKLDAQMLETRAVASEAGQMRGRVQARITGLAGQGALAERLRAGALFAQMRYAGPSDVLWRLMAIQSFDLTGPLELAADMTGSLAVPHIRGSLASGVGASGVGASGGVASGGGLRLQSAQTGTDIRQITARGNFNGAQLSLTGLSGQTSGGGQVTGSGIFDFSNMGNGRGPAIDLRLAARRAQLLSRSDLGLVGTGPLRVVSDGMVGTIAGRLAIDSASWRLGKSSEIADLPNIVTREINRSADVAPASERNMTWRFLVDAAGPGRIKVEGLGLTSEWSADVRLRGTLDEPAIAGHADLVTGGYEFAGKRFELKRGRITFDGNAPPDPRLDIVATADVSGLAASVTVRGSSLKPEIAFASVPALPEEELLSRLLFGDSISKISAPEALQLGAALASLHGGSGLDPINKLRSAIGLDRLRIVSADAALGRQTGVAVGKYLGRHFYAEIITDGRGYSATNLEFRVTNWLALLGSVSTIGRQSLNAKISKDY